MKYRRSLSALALLATLGLSLSACGGSPSAESALVASSQSATATPTATNPADSACLSASESRKYNDDLFVCTMGSDQRLVWLSEAESKRVVGLKAAAEKVMADKAAAEKVMADKAAAEKVVADRAAADKVVADKAAADKAAADKTARSVPAAPAAPAVPAVPAVPAAPAAPYYANCTAARAAGAAPIYKGSPGYGTHLDRDRDGIGCDK